MLSFSITFLRIFLINMNKTLIGTAILFFAGLSGYAQKFDKQSHRGGRGLMPENTIAAMKNALDYGTSLELDLYFSKDKQIIVSHDPYISPVFALNPDGSPVTKAQAKKLKLNDLLYSDILKYDVGSRPHPEFPRQKKMVAHIPLFAELIDSVEAYAKAMHLKPPHYNPEAKVPSGAVSYGPNFRADFIKAMMDIIIAKGIQKRVSIQSFDVGMLEVLHRNYPKIKTSYLLFVGRNKLQDNLNKLTFKPTIYSPYYKDVTKAIVDSCHQMHLQVLPWTVNAKGALDSLKAMKVDGVISDYPDLF